MDNTPEELQPENNNHNEENVEQKPQHPQPPRKKKKKDFINNSGQGDVPVVKVVTDRFNWGAFCFTWIWGIKYKKWITLLIFPASFIPLASIGLQIWFGIAGNKWAWQTTRYKSIQDFHEQQRKWAVVALAVWLSGVVMLACSLIISYIYNKDTETTRINSARQITLKDNSYSGNYRSSGNVTYKKKRKRTQPTQNTYTPNQTMTVDLTKPYSGN